MVTGDSFREMQLRKGRVSWGGEYENSAWGKGYRIE